MLSAAQIAELAASLGSAQGLEQVSAAMESLSGKRIDAQDLASRDELVQTLQALDFLGASIRSMEHIVRAMMGDQDSRAVNCVG